MQDVKLDLSAAKVIAVRPNKKIYRLGNYCVKVFNNDFSKADVLNEALNQARVEETDLDIPKIIEVTKIDGKWAIITEFIEGPTLAELMEKEPEKEDEYMTRFINIQRRILNTKAPMLNKLVDKMQNKISATTLNATARYELHMRLSAIPRQEKICHGDFNPSNVICGTNGTDYVIDWAHVTRGAAEADVARTYLVFWLAGQLERAKKYLDMYCSMTDTAKQQVQKWLPIVAASQSVKGCPEERELLMHWINVVDYE
ncbi:TPA: aminoglycoside phosphotransferase [bacterium UBP9_UBA11836]|nr:aminoglycoside phosphotransferase [bacterium UBP9_UBA11836]